MQQFALAAEQQQHRHQGQRLGNHRGNGGTLYAHVKDDDKQGVQGGIYQHTAQCQYHGRDGMACRTHDGVETKVTVRYYIEHQYYLHILPGIGQGSFRCTEDKQYGVQERHAHDGEQCAQDDI